MSDPDSDMYASLGVPSLATVAVPARSTLTTDPAPSLYEALDEADQEKASDLRERCTASTLLGAFYMVRTGAIDVPALKGKVSLGAYMDFVKVISVLQSGRCAPIEYDPSEPFDLKAASLISRSFTIDTIMAALQQPRAVMAVVYTPTTLPAFILSLSHTSFEVDRDGAGAQTGWKLVCPEFPVVTVSTPPGKQARVVHGGAEFLKRFNTVHESNYEYKEVDADISNLAVFLGSAFQLQKKEDSYVFAPRPITDPLKFREGVDMADDIKFLQLTVGAIHDAMTSGKMNVPSLPSNAQPIKCIELILTMFVEADPARGKQMVARSPSIIQARTARAWDAIEKKVADVIANPIATTVPHITHDKRTVEGSANQVVAGTFAHFREECHRHYRVGLGKAENKKTDTPFGLGFAMSASTVPYKFTIATDMLRRMGHDLTHLEVDAYGNTKENHWSGVIKGTFASAKWFDATYSGEMGAGGVCEKADIRHLRPGSGVGRVLFDDTYDKKAGFNPTAKVAPIIQADYDCGVVKLMMGLGDERAESVTAPPNITRLFLDKYPMVDLFRISPHSLEYFLVFSKREPRISGALKHSSLFSCDGDQPVSTEQLLIRFKTFRRIHASEVYAANIARSITVSCGVPAHPKSSGFALVVNHPITRAHSGGCLIMGRVKGKRIRGAVSQGDHERLQNTEGYADLGPL